MFDCSAVNVSNETLETVTNQVEEADANVQRSEDLLKVFGSTLKMVKLNTFHDKHVSIMFKMV